MNSFRAVIKQINRTPSHRDGQSYFCFFLGEIRVLPPSWNLSVRFIFERVKKGSEMPTKGFFFFSNTTPAPSLNAQNNNISNRSMLEKKDPIFVGR